LVTVDASGRAIKVQGDPSQPITQGFLCGKVAKYLDRVYAPERILHPLRRKPGVAKGPLVRGQEDEAFERVSWDEALDEIAARLQTISDEHRPESILPYSYAGTIGVLGSFTAWAGASSTGRSAPRRAGWRGTWSTARSWAWRRRISGWPS
jgi:anaerobic selenocysteine-containing dehydrogenase